MVALIKLKKKKKQSTLKNLSTTIDNCKIISNLSQIKVNNDVIGDEYD